jgi:heme exporter protein A
MLEVRSLACSRGERRLFSDLDFEVLPGDVLWVEGANGSGKTTLLRTLCGLSSCDDGAVYWDGKAIGDLQEVYQRELLYVAHGNALKDDLTVGENLRFAARIAGELAEDRALAEALEACGLGDRRDLPVRVLSQGQKRRTTLARLWLADSRRLWILDEPFAALDVDSVSRLAQRIGSHVNAGGMAVLTTHQEVPVAAVRTRRLRLSD